MLYYSVKNNNAVKRLIASKIQVFVYIIHMCVLCVFIIYIQIYTHTVYILKIFPCIYLYNLYYYI